MKNFILKVCDSLISKLTKHEWVQEPFDPEEVRCESSFHINTHGWQQLANAKFICSKCGNTIVICRQNKHKVSRTMSKRKNIFGCKGDLNKETKFLWVER